MRLVPGSCEAAFYLVQCLSSVRELERATTRSSGKVRFLFLCSPFLRDRVGGDAFFLIHLAASGLNCGKRVSPRGT